MPLSPSDIDAMVTPANDPDITVHFDIDEFLVESRFRSRPSPYTYGIAKLPKEQIDRLIATYTAAGWTVKLVYDDRDGNFLTFERAHP